SVAAQTFLRNHYSNLANVLTLLGKHADAARAAERLPQVVPNDSHCLGAAGFLFRCVRLAEKDDGLSASDRAAAVRLYTERMRRLFDEAKGHRARPEAASKISPGFTWGVYYATACGFAFLAASADDTGRSEHYATCAVEMLQQIVRATSVPALSE